MLCSSWPTHACQQCLHSQALPLHLPVCCILDPSTLLSASTSGALVVLGVTLPTIAHQGQIPTNAKITNVNPDQTLVQLLPPGTKKMTSLGTPLHQHLIIIHKFSCLIIYIKLAGLIVSGLIVK